MKNVLQSAVDGIGAEIARHLKITPQGFSSKIRADPAETLKQILVILKKIGRRKRAMLIIEDLMSFVEYEFEQELAHPFPLTEAVETLQTTILLEIKHQNRLLILSAWQRVQMISAARVRELTSILKDESSANYGITRESPAGVPFRGNAVRQAKAQLSPVVKK